MADINKVGLLLVDPEVRVVVFGLAHTGHASFAGEPGPARLRAMLSRLLEASDADQRRSWLSDSVENSPITVDQVRAAFGDEVIKDLARYAQSSAVDVTWQLSALLPDLVDALTPGGNLVRTSELRRELDAAAAAGDQTSGPFGPRLY
ncbi:YidB family protein [Dactylosporangium salmoneum]|uniref:Uncharacterized protein n=1 Tax=Dactylosporangium salmoneum TaxID=53361 RepID=A0ABP5TV64_9ACTN